MQPAVSATQSQTATQPDTEQSTTAAPPVDVHPDVVQQTMPPDLPQTPLKAWSYTTDVMLLQTPLVSDNQVFFTKQGDLVTALALDSGDVIWQKKYRDVRENTLALGDTALYIARQGGTLLALNRKTGDMLWEHSLGQESTAPGQEINGVVYWPTATVGTNIPPENKGHAQLVALQALTGEIQWQLPLDAYLLSSPIFTAGVGYVGGPRDYSQEDEGGVTQLTAFNMDDGAVLWQRDLKAGRPKDMTVYQDTLQLLGYRDILYGLSAGNGQIVWKFPTGNWTEGFEADSDNVYLGSATSTVYALQSSTGNEVWRWQAEGQFNYVVDKPVISQNSLIFATTFQQIVALDTVDGHQLWQISASAMPASAPGVTEDWLVQATQDGLLTAYQLP